MQIAKNDKNVNVIFITSDGEKISVEVPVGTSVLEAAHQNGVPLEGACEGSLACSTCHVILEKEYYSKLPDAIEEEEDMLDMAFGLTPTSRLGCQIILTNELEGMILTIPSKTRNESAKSK
ncbi:2Fe-2S ferredoxin [Candidatus Hepatincolaceae symbiont of Richtersius coronifer]